MNPYLPLTNIHSYVTDKFFTLRRQAVRDVFLAKLIRKNTMLAMFPEQAPEKSPNRIFSGMQNIPVQKIIGTMNRQLDFDHQFRPLKQSLRDRWIKVYLSLEKDGWSPILVHKVGEDYYIEDGHHRVSVARSLGMVCIEAEVWEYPADLRQAKKCPAARCPERSSVHVYAAR